MRMLVWKELHENLKWAALPSVLLVGYMLTFGVCLCGPFFGFISFVGAILGGSLGLLQTTFESSGDRRSLLFHRPIRPTQILLSKVIAGSLLYLIAMGVPLAGYVIFRFLPGYVAPQLPLSVRWYALCPWFADIITGLAYYFAGLLAGLCPGRWYGRRILGFPVAILASFLAWNLGEFWHVLAALCLLSTLMGIAAWGIFLTADDMAAQPASARVSLALTLLMGLSVTAVGVKVIVEYYMFPRDDRHYSARYVFARDGRILFAENIDNRELRVSDLEGNELDQFRQKGIGEAQADLGQISAPSSGSVSVAWSMRCYRNVNTLAVQMSNPTKPLHESWCYVPQLGLLVGYDIAARKVIGCIGPDGFTSLGEAAGERFPSRLEYPPSPAYPEFLVVPNGVYDINFNERRAKRLFSPGDGEVVFGASVWRTGNRPIQKDPDDKYIPGILATDLENVASHQAYVVGTNRAIYVLNEQGDKLHTFPMIDDPYKYAAGVLRLESPDRMAVTFHPSYLLGLAIRETTPIVFVEYSADDQEIARKTLPRLRFQNDLQQQYWMGLLTSPAEGIFGHLLFERILLSSQANPKSICTQAECMLFEGGYRITPHHHDLAEGLVNTRIRLFTMLIGVHSVLSLVVAIGIARRLSFSLTETFLASTFALIFGIVGCLVIVCSCDWPQRVACPSCQRRRVVTRENCEFCDQPFATPVPDGTEVFA